MKILKTFGITKRKSFDKNFQSFYFIFKKTYLIYVNWL